MMEIECLACGKTIKPLQLNDTDNYDGQIVCQGCKSLLYVKAVKVKVQKYKIIKENSKNFNFTKMVIDMQKERNQQEKEK